MTIKRYLLRTVAACCLYLNFSSAQAFVLNFEAADFGLTTVFSNVTTFEFSIDVAGPLTAGTTYTAADINSVDYNVFGLLAATPPGFPAFNLVRSIIGTDFINQGSSMSFEVSASANLADGLQVSELVGSAPVFVFNVRVVNTSRYHPPLFELNADGTGRIQNSNNTGGVNPSSMQVVDVDFGEEYITDLTFNASTTTLADAPASIPEPSIGIPLMLVGFMGLSR